MQTLCFFEWEPNKPMPTLLVKRITNEKLDSIADRVSCLEDEAAEIPVACMNWPRHPYCPRVSFKIGHTQTEIWLKFFVAEERIRALETRTHGAVSDDSCVEFFVSFDGTNYYNLEVSCIGTPHLGYGPGRQDRRYVPHPLMERMAIRSSLGNQPFAEKSGAFIWALTVRLPVACFAFDTITSLSGLSATANFYKVGSGLSVPHYVTWHPVGTAEPDYHRPEFFGALQFE